MLSLALALMLAQGPQDDCLGFVCDNLAKGNGNFLTYYRFSEDRVEIRKGDLLVYDVLLDPKNPLAKGGIDAFMDSGPGFRDLGAVDQNGLRSHGDAILKQAVGQWYTRRIAMEPAVGRRAESWYLVFEGDEHGTYAQFLDNVRVERAQGDPVWIYKDGQPKVRKQEGINGYSRFPFLAVVPREATKDLDAAKKQVVDTATRVRNLEKARQDVELAKKFLDQNPDPHLKEHIQEANEALDRVMQNPTATNREVEAALHTVRHALQHTHPVMEEYTGHLVGHAHIDLMWLWEWQEGIVATHDTFNQAVKFMDEFPGFTFSQSSSALYKTIEENYPELFKKIQAKVRKGQWELVGGRVDEGDTNMISPESHARHFLYGQSYFKQKFGKKARVGWEPDTFGHAITMPQILKLGGMDSYYFCRGGKGKPLFWWEGLDGTRILTFDEPASGSWYNGDLSYQQFQELLDFRKNTGSKDTLWVYGVGNHGGGPTREMIEEALSWMKDPSKPKVQFSTAAQFFDKLRTYNLNRIPVIKDELNPVFEGCYTSHSEVKQLNRKAEYTMSTAEAIATVASMFGFAYPKASFQRNWEDITFHHHHDTLPGSFIHPASEKTKIQLNRVIADGDDIIQRALETLTLRVTPQPGGPNILVFNPSGWTRTGWVETYAWYADFNQSLAAIAPDGKQYPIEVIDRTLRRIRFWAADVPAFGYKVFAIGKGNVPSTEERASIDVPMRLSNEFFDVEFNNEIGAISKLVDKRSGRNWEVVPQGGSMGRLEMHHENPGGMSAWTLGQIGNVETLKMGDMARGSHTVTFTTYQESFNNPGHLTRITQTYRLLPGSDQIEVDVDCDWHAIGTDRNGGKLLRVAFDTNLQNPTATYEVPFGALSRPANGQEVVGLNWQDLSTPESGVAVLNDSKSGMSATGSTMRLSLIRSSYDPDTNPNPGLHHWRYAIVPHQRDWAYALMPRRGFEFQQPMLAMTVPGDAKGTNPLEWSPLQLSDSTVIPVALKRSEDGNDLILRVYQSTGATSDGSVRFAKPLRKAVWVNFIEEALEKARFDGATVPLPLRSFEIKTLRATPK